MSVSKADDVEREIVDYSDRMSDNDDHVDDDVKQRKEDDNAATDIPVLAVSSSYSPGEASPEKKDDQPQ